jgi:Protein of unknown function, DUF547
MAPLLLGRMTFLLSSMDWFKPVLYAVEKQVANIPDVSMLEGRWKLDDSDLGGAASVSTQSDPDQKSLGDHVLWDQLMKQYVHTDCTIGSIPNCHAVDYEGLAKDPFFPEYLKQLETVDLDSLTRNEQLALWINAYNALCIQLIIQNGSPLPQSINELSTNGQKVWDKEAGIVAGVPLSLNQIEHERLRGQWDLPAIHACIVCASASCPNLRPEAFVASRLAVQMKSQVEDWLENPTKGLALQENQELKLSRIFLWFGSDFGNEIPIIPGLSVAKVSQFRTWLAQFIKEPDMALRVEKGSETIRYFEYDWSLNLWKADGVRNE